MSFRSKKSRSTQSSNVKDATNQSVQDTIAQVIQDVASENPQEPETLFSSSYGFATDTNQPATSKPLEVQGTTIGQHDDDLSNHRYATRQSQSTQSLSQPHISDSTRRRRSSRRQSLLAQEPIPSVDVEEVHATETRVSSCYNHETDDPACNEPFQANTTKENDAEGDYRQSNGRIISTQVDLPILADSQRRVRSSNKQALWDQDSDDEPEQLEISQLRPSKRPKWTDDIEFGEMEEVEMRDASGRSGKKGGKVFPRHVWSLQPGVRFVVPFNEIDQPVRKGGHILVRFLGDLAKKGELCPIGDESWPKVDKSCKDKIIALVRDKFVLPDRREIDKDILKRVGNSWRMYRHELKLQYKKPDKTEEQVASVVPEGVFPSQWVKLVKYWFSDKCQLLSTRGKEARAALSHLHTSGSKSFARKRDEFEKAHGREPGPLEWFVQTHRKKDGTYADKLSKEFLDAAAGKIAEQAPTSSSKRVAIENQVFNELMYSGDERCKRPIGYGLGVNRGKVFGSGAKLRKKRYFKSGSSSEAVNLFRNSMSEVKAEPEYMKSDTSAEVERLRFSVEAMCQTNQHMQSQLQKQSKQLKLQAKQLQMQTQQMEQLHLQLQHVTSLLTKSMHTASKAVKHRSVGFLKSQVPDDYFVVSSEDESESSEWDSD